MRISSTIVAALATAAILASLTTPALAGKGGGNGFFNGFGSFFNFDGGGGPKGYKPWGGGGYGGGYNKHGNKSYQDNPGTPASPGTNTIVYFGTCLNLAGFQQAGNAGPDGYCLPFESLVGNEGSPGSGPTCTVTTTQKSYSGGEMSFASSSYGGGSATTTTETVAGTCAAYQAANPPSDSNGGQHGDHVQ